MLTATEQLGAAGAGLVGGLLSGFFGVGGNFILVPLLGLALGLNQQQAQGLTLAALLPPLGAPAVWQYHRAGVPVLWRVVGVAICGFLPAIPLGSYLANRLSAELLRVVFAALLVVMAVRTWRAPKSHSDNPLLHQAPPGYVPVALAAGATAGLASGLLGIGGALVLIPFFTRGLHVNQRQAQVLSLAMLLPPIALPGVWVYAQAQAQLPWAALIPVALGFLMGAFTGARLNRVVSAAKLTRGFALLLATSALVLVVKAVGLGW